MRIEVLREFIAIVKLGGFNRAARKLHLSQSSLSAHIAALEKNLGFKLFDRSTQPPAATLEGQIFLEYAQDIVTLYDEGRAKGLSAKGKTRIRMMEAASFPFLQQVIDGAELGDSVQFVDLPTRESKLEALESGSVDILFVSELATRTPEYLDYADECRFVPLGYQPIAMAYSKANSLLSKEPLQPSDLNGVTAIITDPTYFDYWTQMLREILGEDIALTTRLKPVFDTPSELSRSDLKNDVYFCGQDRTAKIFEKRDDIAVIDRIGNIKLQYACGLAYKKSRESERLKAVVEKLRKAADALAILSSP